MIFEYRADVDSYDSPEKNHAAQIQALHQLLHSHPQLDGEGSGAVKLVLIGGCRNDEDAKRVDELRRLAKDLKLEVSRSLSIYIPTVLLKDYHG